MGIRRFTIHLKSSGHAKLIISAMECTIKNTNNMYLKAVSDFLNTNPMMFISTING